jgi:uncharacterized membrane protein YphA (DoxX/SURF4 family)
MGIAVWILQFLLAIAFCAAGLMKLLRPKEELRERMAWVEGVTPRGIKLIGLIELLGGLGLVLPALTGIAPILTLLAAIGLAIVMLAAIIVHRRIGDPLGQMVPALLLLVLLLLCIWGLVAQGRY